MSRKGAVMATALLIMGMVLAAITLVALYRTAVESNSWIRRIMGEEKDRFQSASTESFKRLSGEIEGLEEDSHKYIPYTIGKGYILIGFSRQEKCFEEDFSKPDKCEDACLCLCDKRGCEYEDCREYTDVDHLVFAENFWNDPSMDTVIKKVEGLEDPVTGEDLRCFSVAGVNSRFIGGASKLEKWKTQNVLIEKTVSDGETFVLMAVESDYTEDRIKKTFPCDQFDSFPHAPPEGCDCGGEKLLQGEGVCIGGEIKADCSSETRCDEENPICCSYDSYSTCIENPAYCTEIEVEGSFVCPYEQIEGCCECHGEIKCYGYCCGDRWSEEDCSSEEICSAGGEWYDYGETICGSATRFALIGCRPNWVCGCNGDGTWTLDRRSCGDESCVEGECVPK